MFGPRQLLDFSTPGRTHRYGSHSSQTAELHLPKGHGPHPVMIVIHGGSWRARYGKLVMRGLAGDLRRRGWAVWNIEYRRVGDGGGWPATFQDVGAAIDRLAEIDASLDLKRVSLLGHSAGGHLALWAAARQHGPVTLRRVVSQAGVCDLTRAYRLWGGGAVEELMGGSPAQFPERFEQADPLMQVPLRIPTLLVHGTQDQTVTVELSRRYEQAARAAGATIELIEIDGVDGAHRAHIDPRGRAWAAVTGWLDQQLADGGDAFGGDPARLDAQAS